MLEVRRSARFVAWGNAWLDGHVSLDDAADRIVGHDEPHRVHGLPGETDDAGTAIVVALGRLRGLGIQRLRLVLPAPGDPTGLPGPTTFNAEAIEAGEAVLTVGGEPLALVPDVRTIGTPDDWICTVRWQVSAVNPPWATALPSLAEAERELREALREATDELVQLDVARWRPELADALSAIRDGAGADDALPPGYPPRARRVLVLARRVGAIATLADDTGAAMSAQAMAARTAALRPLTTAARRAEVAAFNSVTEPSPRR